MDRSGYARATLAPRIGLEAPVPALDPRAILTMADMGHGDHAGHDMSGHGMKMDTPEAGKPAPASAHDHAAMGHAAPGNASMQVDHSMHGASGANTMVSHPASETRSEEHTSELQSLMRISYAVFCLKKKQTTKPQENSYVNQ